MTRLIELLEEALRRARAAESGGEPVPRVRIAKAERDIEHALFALPGTGIPVGPPRNLHVVFTTKPSGEPNACQFVEVEDGAGHGLSVGEWRDRPDGFAELVIDLSGDNADTRAYHADIVAQKVLAWKAALAARDLSTPEAARTLSRSIEELREAVGWYELLYPEPYPVAGAKADTVRAERAELDAIFEALGPLFDLRRWPEPVKGTDGVPLHKCVADAVGWLLSAEKLAELHATGIVAWEGRPGARPGHVWSRESVAALASPTVRVEERDGALVAIATVPMLPRDFGARVRAFSMSSEGGADLPGPSAAIVDDPEVGCPFCRAPKGEGHYPTCGAGAERPENRTAASRAYGDAELSRHRDAEDRLRAYLNDDPDPADARVARPRVQRGRDDDPPHPRRQDQEGRVVTKKPYYKLVIGKKPFTSADTRFDCGRVRIELSDALKDRFKLADVFDVRWTPMLKKMLAFWDAHAGDPVGVTLTEPPDRPLRAEVAALEARQAEAKARREAARSAQ